MKNLSIFVSALIALLVSFNVSAASKPQVVERYETKVTTEVVQNTSLQTNYYAQVLRVPEINHGFYLVTNLVAQTEMNFAYSTNMVASPVKNKKAKGNVVKKEEVTVTTEVVRTPVLSTNYFERVVQVPCTWTNWVDVTNIVAQVQPVYTLSTNTVVGGVKRTR